MHRVLLRVLRDLLDGAPSEVRKGMRSGIGAARAVTGSAVALAAVLALGLPGPAHAEDPYSRSGCYVGAAGGIATPTELEGGLKGPVFEDQGGVFDPSDLPELAFVDADVDDSVTVHGRVGCRSGWLGGELHFEWIDGFDAGVESARLGRDETKLRGWAATGDVKLYPFTGRIQPFATAGFGYLRFEGDLSDGLADPGGVDFDLDDLDVDDWDFVVRMGGGLELYATRHIALTVDASYLLPLSGSLKEFDYLSLTGGLLYRF